MKRFDFITEADARQLEPGSQVVLARGGHVTPLAQDTLRERRVTLVAEGLPGEDALSLVPRSPVRRLAIGSDHTGTAMKARLTSWLRSRGLAVEDVGTRGAETVDYPDIAEAVARLVSRGEVDAGIVIDGAGLGSSIAANKVAGVRAVPCVDVRTARYAREHNGANVLSLGASLLSQAEAVAIVDAWLSASMTEPRYIQRLLKIARLEGRRRD